MFFDDLTHPFAALGLFFLLCLTMPLAGYAQCNLAPPTTQSVIQCGPGSATLEANGAGGVIAWYNDSGSLGSIATGSPLVTPFLSESETYYAAVTTTTLSTWDFATDLQGWTAATQCGLNTVNWVWNSDGGQGTAFAESASGNSSLFLSSPVIDVAGASAINFDFIHRFNTETCCDHGYAVYRLDGGAWQRFVPTTGPYNIFDFMYNDPFLGGCGNSPDIDVFAGDNGGYQESGGLQSVMGASTVEVGFLFTSDASFADEGWYINAASVEVICESPRVQVDVTVLPLQDAPTTVSASTCGGASATVSVSSNTANPAPMFQWFDDVVGGNLIGSGSTFSDSPSETTTYWVEEVPGGPQLDQSWTFDTDAEGWTLATQCDLPSNWEWNSDANRGALLANNPAGGNTSMLAISPMVNVSSFEEVFFSYNHRFNTETCCDHGYVVYRLDGGPWEVFQAGDYPVFDFMYNDPILGACGNSPDTTVYAGDSGGYLASGGLLDVSGATNLEVAFLYTSDASFVDEGWYINSVRLLSTSNCPSERAAATIFISDAPPAPTVENQDQCLGLTSTLTAQSNSGLPNPAFEWYDAPAAGNLLASGPTYQFEPAGPTTIYVQELAQSSQQWSFDSDFEGWTATANCGLTDNWLWNDDGGQGSLFASNPGGGNSSMLLRSPPVMVTGSEEVQLTYNHRFNTETCCDHGYVVYRLDGGPWEVFQAGDYPVFDFMYNDPILGACGNSPDMDVYAGDSGGYFVSSGAIPTSGAQSLEVAFLFTSDASFVDEGWYINDVTIDGVAQIDCPSPRVPLVINFPVLTAPLVNDAEICPPQLPILTAMTTSGTTNSQFEWYDAPVDGNLVFTGNPFTPNPIPLSNTSFYVEEVITGQRVWSFDEDLEGWSTNGECGFSDTWQWVDEEGEGALFARQSGGGNSSIFLQSPPVDVSADEGVVQFSYRHRYNTETCCDHGYVVYRLDGGPWEVFQAGDYPLVDFMYNDPILGACGDSPDTTVYAGDSGGYILSSGSIDVGGAASLEVGFLYTSDASFVDDGWYLSKVIIDDIKSTCVGPRSEAQVLPTGGLPDPTVEDIAACPNENLDLFAVSNSGLLNPLFEWYDAPVAGNLLFTGNPYPIVTGGLTTYYVEEFTSGDGFWTFDDGLEGWSANAQCDLLENGNWEAVDDAGTSALFAQQNGAGNSSMFLESPIFALDGQASIDYSFRHRFNTETCCDHGYVLARIDGGPWVQITPTTNTYNDFDFMYNDPFLGDCGNSPDINVYAGDSGGYLTSTGSVSVIGATTLQIGFLYTSDPSFVDDGWYIDEVLIEDIYPGCRSERVALNILDQGDIPILFDCPGDVLTPNDMGVCNALVELVSPTATDGCDGPPLAVTGMRSDGLALDQPYPLGTTTVEWSATDADANTASCMTMVVVVDTEIPMANCNNPIVPLGPDGTADLTTGLIDNSSQDNCGITARTLDIDQVDCADIGPPIPVTLTVTDAAGNVHSCIAQVTVVDDFPPKALCQDIDLPLLADNTAMLLPQQVDNGSNDNCGAVTLSVSPDQFTCDDIGPNTVTLDVLDSYGNMASCQATVTVVEGAGDCNVPPVANCQNVTRAADDNCVAMVLPEEVDNGSFDPDGDPITITLTPSGPYGLGITVVTLKVADPFGEEDTCEATIEVVDETPPTITCPADITVECDEDTSPANTGTATATDNCFTPPVVAFADVITPTSCPQEYTIARTWTATDGSGLTSSCVQIITVEDTTAPEPVCNTIRIFLSASGQYTLTQADIDAIALGSSDNCDDDFTYMVDQTFFDCSDIDLMIGAIGGAEVELTVTDCAGNSDVCTAIVEIDDSAVPFDFGCIGDLNVTLGPDCSVTITPDMVVTGFDDCIDSYNLMVDGLDSDQAVGCGEHTYMIEMIEDGEIVYTCWGSIFAEDKTNPVVDCPDNTDNVDVEFDLQTLDGSIDGTEPSINLADYSCFQSFFEPADGVAYNYDLITFTVDPDLPETDVYNIQTISNIPGLNIALFQGAFNEDNPCENILGGSEGAYFVDPFFGVNAFFDQNFRIELALQPGQTYTLFVANTSFGTTGNYTVGIVSDNGGTFENSGFSAPQPVVANLPLYCEDLNLVEVTEPMTYMVSANGDIMPGTLSAELAAILDLTGYPDVTDNCGPVLVTVTDDVNENGDCGSIVITRTFLVSDRADGICTGAPRTAICTQLITLNRPTVFDLVLPPYTAALECDEDFATDGSVGGPDDNPAASATGYPFLLTAQGYVDLSQTYCNLGANYSDEPRINVCEGSYKFRREWNIIDWCSPSDNVIWQQYVKVGDFTGPNILNSPDNIDISTSPFSCVANIAIPALDVIDDNGCSEAFATTYTILAFGDTFFATGNINDGDVVSAPIGVHTLIRCAEDDCGNETCVETTLTITDQIEPSAACNDELNVSIGGGDVLNGIEGIARIFATDINEGSYDNCGEVTLEVRRNFWRDNTCDPSPNRFSPWGDFVDFYCCDIANEITIELRVTDESGNQNICWMVITPEDKLIPFCYAPDDVELDCNELPLTFPGDIEEAYDTDFNGTSVMMTALFGGASGTDNCAVDTIIERTPNIQVNECGWGTITRRFEAWQLRPEGDVNGNGAIDISEVFRSNNSCFQVITVNEVHDFEIDFPEDAAADCGDPDVPEIITTATGCDVLSVNVGAPVLFSATGDECYKYSITYDVINWCVWDGEYEGLRLPRITEDDGEDLPIDRGVEGNERPVVSVVSSVGPVDNDCDGLADAGGDDIQYTVVIDRRHTDREGDSSIPNTVYDNIPGNGIPCIPADQFGRRNYGRYVYTQFVKVYDSTAPVVTVGDFGGPTDNCPDLAPGQFGDDDGNCEEAVSIPFSVSDECELFDGDGVLVVEIVSAELDAFAVDANNDGDIKANEFVAEAGSDGDVLSNITDNGDGTYSFDGTYPIIPAAMGDNVYHAVRILFRDGCGNLTSTIIVFDVIDCKGPAPICINGLTVTLMPQDDGGCAMAIWANDFEASPIDDCTGQGPDLGPSGLPRVTSYAIYRAEDAQVPGFEPNPIVTGLVLTEEDEGEVVVYIYAFDEEGNYNYCETYLLVQQHTTCDDGSNTAMIAGVIATEFDETVEGVEVSINGEMTDVMMTATDGAYSFSNLPLGGDYTVTPYLNANPLNGVTTFDLVKISKHILNVDLLDSPYKMIAADANRSNTITTLDLIQIRKLILNVITEFPNNTSWRFVETAYAFPQVTNPWLETFPELISENNLAGDVLDADFVGVKIGDVNGSAAANALASDDRNLNGIFNLSLENASLRAGNVYTIAVSGEQLEAIKGYQGTLQLNGADLIDIEYGIATAENFGLRYAAQGAITMSWNSGSDGLTSVSTEDVLFSLVIRPTVDAELSDVISVNSRYTAAEAYGAPSLLADGKEVLSLGIQFSESAAAAAGFELYQNTPNPFAIETLIGFNLPEDAEAIVTISDASGRLITQLRGDYAAGYNTLNITKQMIQGATGVLTYTVTASPAQSTGTAGKAGEFTATKQMIVVK